MRKYILSPDSDSIRLKLKRDRTRIIKQGFPWIYSDCLEDLPPAPAGAKAMVKDLDGSLLAFGFYDRNCPLAFRVCALEKERLNDDLVENRLNSALQLRRRFVENTTSGYRLINGEGDRLPGLVCDIYGKHAVLKLDGSGPLGFWNLAGISEWLNSNCNIETVYHKFRSDAEHRGEVIFGDLDNETVSFQENGVKFRANIVEGQKTGFFFDQRGNRNLVRKFSLGMDVLNIFSYTGGFSIYAGLGGANSVTSVDIAKPAIEECQANWELNNLDNKKHVGQAVDAFKFLETAKAESRTWNLVVVDPPSFAPAEKHVSKAKEAYQALFSAALQVSSSDGLIAFSSCSSHIPQEMFMEICQAALSKARRRAKVLGIHGQPADHPFPLACRELQYLKFVLLQVN